MNKKEKKEYLEAKKASEKAYRISQRMKRGQELYKKRMREINRTQGKCDICGMIICDGPKNGKCPLFLNTFTELNYKEIGCQRCTNYNHKCT